MEASFPKRYDIKFFLSVFVLRLSVLKCLCFGLCNQTIYICEFVISVCSLCHTFLHWRIWCHCKNDNSVSKSPRFQWTIVAILDNSSDSAGCAAVLLDAPVQTAQLKTDRSFFDPKKKKNWERKGTKGNFRRFSGNPLSYIRSKTKQQQQKVTCKICGTS